MTTHDGADAVTASFDGTVSDTIRTQNSAGEGNMPTVLLQQLGRAAIGVDVGEEP